MRFFVNLNRFCRTILFAVLVALAGSVILPPSALALYGRVGDSMVDPKVILIDENDYLGNAIPRDITFVDGDGKEFTIEDLLDKPLILVISYFTCDGACTTANRNMRDLVVGAEKSVPGKDFNLLTVSFDSKDTAMNLKMFKEEIEIPADYEEGWRLGLFKNKEDIERLTSSVGFKFFWLERDQMFMHPSMFVFISPQLDNAALGAGGRIVRYLYASTIESVDLDIAIADTNFGTFGRSKVDDLKDLFLIACFSYNYVEGRYTWNTPILIATGALLMSGALLALSIVIIKSKKRRVVHNNKVRRYKNG